MRDELISRIRQDFYFIKYILGDNKKLAQYLKIDFAYGKELNNTLRLSIENAYIEAKKSILSELFFILDDAIYRMITPGRLSEAIKITNKLIFLTIINIKILSNKNRNVKRPGRRKLTFDDFGLKEIVTRIPKISKQHIEATRYVRLITGLLKKYKDTSLEREEQLLVAPERAKEAIIATYDKQLEEIIISIKKQYFNIATTIPELKEMYEAEINKEVEDEVEDFFDTLNFTSLEQFLFKELSEFCRLRSSLVYIKSEGVDVLSIIMELFKSRQFFQQLFKDEELALFKTLSDNNLEVNRFEELENRINLEIQDYIQDKFIVPYTAL